MSITPPPMPSNIGEPKSDHKALWKRVGKTDPAAVKPITGKQYQGNSPKPYWLIERATEEFGPVGIGWGVIVKSERFERLGEFDVLHVAVVSVWYVLNGKRSETFDQMGGTKAAYKTAKGVLMVDEDAGKKSVTDGMVKCLSMVGFAGDIFSGRWDDSKYVAELRREFADKEDEDDGRAPAKVRHTPVPTPKAGAHADALATSPQISKEWKDWLGEFAEKVCTIFDSNGDDGPKAAWELIEKEKLEDTQLIYLSSILPSGVRNPIKDYSHVVHAKKRETAKT